MSHHSRPFLRHQLRGDSKEASQSGVGMMMSMRKLANHPVLLRYHYDEEKVRHKAEVIRKAGEEVRRKAGEEKGKGGEDG